MEQGSILLCSPLSAEIHWLAQIICSGAESNLYFDNMLAQAVCLLGTRNIIATDCPILTAQITALQWIFIMGFTCWNPMCQFENVELQDPSVKTSSTSFSTLSPQFTRVLTWSDTTESKKVTYSQSPSILRVSAEVAYLGENVCFIWEVSSAQYIGLESQIIES